MQSQLAVLPKVGSGSLQLESQYLRGKVDRKESFLYFGGWQPGERVGSCPKANSALTISGQEFQGCIGGRRGLHAETAQSALTAVLKLGMQWSDQRHLDCFKYS